MLEGGPFADDFLRAIHDVVIIGACGSVREARKLKGKKGVPGLMLMSAYCSPLKKYASLLFAGLGKTASMVLNPAFLREGHSLTIFFGPTTT